MSFVCGLCREHNDGWGRKLTIQPDMPACQARDVARVCADCARALDQIDSNGCGWCGSDALWEVYPVINSTASQSVISPICRECWAKANDEHPPAFTEELKESIREESDRKCSDCGMPEESHKREYGTKLHVHHKNGDKYNNSKENLIALCARCHGSK